MTATGPADLERARRVAVQLEQELAQLRKTVAGHIVGGHLNGGPAMSVVIALEEALAIEGIDLAPEIADWHFPKWNGDES